MALTAALLAVVAGSIVYSLLTIIAARQYLSVQAPVGQVPGLPMSVLKPLSGAEDQLEENLRTFFTQRYASYEILFAVRQRDDPAVAVVEKLRIEYPAIPVRLIVTGEPPYPNAKVYSLDLMKSAATSCWS